MKKQKLNIKLLRQIQKHITEEPRRFMMAWYEVHGVPGTNDWEQAWTPLYDVADTVPACGSAACIAGWANALTGAQKGEWDDPDRAAKKIGLLGPGLKLFGYPADFWPEPFGERYMKAKTPKARAKVACERIDHLIATGE